MPSKPDRPKVPRPRTYEVVLRDGHVVEIEADHRAMARHYAKSLAERQVYMSSMGHYRTVMSCRLKG
jgi:hypothetical protein